MNNTAISSSIVMASGEQSAVPTAAGSNLFSQIELMMAAARNEAASMEEVKQKAKESDELRARNADLDNQVSAAKEMNYGLRRTMGDLDRQNAQLRHDMQSLNDIYHTEHREFLAAQQQRQNLDQEVLRLKHELAYSKSEHKNNAELWSSHESLLSESGGIKNQLDAMKTANSLLMGEKEALQEVYQREREKLARDLVSSEAEAQRLRTAAEECVMNEEAMRVRMKVMESQHGQALDRSKMGAEDRASSEVRLHSAAVQTTRENAALRRDVTLLRTEVQQLQDASVDAETQFIAATSRLKDVIAKHECELSGIQLKVVEMREVVGALKAQNQELEQEAAALRMQHFSLVVEARTHSGERDQLQEDVNRLEGEKKQLEGVVATVNRTAESQMDELMVHMRSMSTQNEALQNQVNDAQSKYWEEMKRFKDTEAALQAQINALQKDAKDHAHQLQTLQNDKEAARTEGEEKVTVLTLQAQELRVEVEQSHHLVAKLTTDKGLIEDTNATLSRRLADADESARQYLHMIKTAFESERAQLEEEVKKRSQKVKSIDVQRQELLKETHELGTLLGASQGEADRLRGELSSVTDKAQSSTTEVDGLRSRVQELTAEVKAEAARVAAAQSTSELLRCTVHEKESALATLQDEMGKWQEEKSHAHLRISELTERMEVFKAQHREGEYELMTLRNVHDGVRGELQRVSSERDQLAIAMARVEGEKASMEGKLARETAALDGQREDLQSRLQHAHQQCDSTLAQLRDMQNKHWEEMRALKDAEALLLSEADSLSQELQQKTTLLTTARTEAMQMEQGYKDEVGRLSHITGLMTDELEKRVTELSQVNAERTALLERREVDKKRIEDLEGSVKSMEGTFKSTIETDRAKLSDEMRKRAAKTKALEGDKQLLLQETNELSTQLAAAERDMAGLRSQLAGATDQLVEAQRQREMVQTRNSEMLEELKSAARREQDLRMEFARVDERFRTEDAKAEYALKEVKKHAAQQLMDLTNQLRSNQEDNERLKAQMVDLAAAERRAVVEVERSRKDVELVMSSRDEMHQQTTHETQSLRRELTDQRVKVKHLSEAKAVMEVDMVNARLQLQKTEEELNRMRDRSDALAMKLSNVVGDAESSKQSIKDELRAAKQRGEEYASKVAYLEDMLSKQRVEMERVLHDVSRAEREGFNDNVRLKAQLEMFDQEASDLRPLVPLLRKENAESKLRLEKLQSASTTTVNSLLDELKTAEGALSSERKKAQQEAEGHRMQIMELQTAVERAKDNIEESVSRAKSDRTDKDKRIQLLENEVERLKVVSLSKDGRVEDLERQHQDDRARLVAMGQKVEASDRLAADATAALEQKRAHVESLEKKAAASIAGGAGAPPSERGERSRVTRGSFHDDYRDNRDNRDNQGGRARGAYALPLTELSGNVEFGGSGGGGGARYAAGGLAESGSAVMRSSFGSRIPRNEDQYPDQDQDQYHNHDRDRDQDSLLEDEGGSPLPVPAHSHVPVGPQGPPLSPMGVQSSSQGFQQSPIDRVAAALAARAMKDRDASRGVEVEEYDSRVGGAAAVEQSIQRTESLIKQRLRAAGAGAGGAGGGNSGSTDHDENDYSGAAVKRANRSRPQVEFAYTEGKGQLPVIAPR